MALGIHIQLEMVKFNRKELEMNKSKYPAKYTGEKDLNRFFG